MAYHVSGRSAWGITWIITNDFETSQTIHHYYFVSYLLTGHNELLSPLGWLDDGGLGRRLANGLDRLALLSAGHRAHRVRPAHLRGNTGELERFD